MKKKSLLTILGIFVGIAVLVAQEKINKKFDGIDEIEMSVGSGDAIFGKSAGSEVTVDLEHTFGEDYNPTIEKRGNTLVIKEERNRGNYNGRATWTINLPDDLEISFNTGSGDVEVVALTVDASMNSGSGDFDLRRTNGDFSINTGSGDIIAGDVDGSLSLNTGSGDIDLDAVRAGISANTGSGDIKASSIEFQDRSSLNAGSGEVSVSLGSELAYDLSVNSGSGDASLDFNGNKMNGELVMEANKKNGLIKAPFDFDKEEEMGSGSNTTVRKSKKLGSADVKIRIGTGSGTAEVRE